MPERTDIGAFSDGFRSHACFFAFHAGHMGVFADDVCCHAAPVILTGMGVTLSRLEKSFRKKDRHRGV